MGLTPILSLEKKGVSMSNTIAFLIDRGEFKPAELRLLRKLFKKGDVSELLRYERKILEFFWKITQSGQVVEVKDLAASDAIQQLSLFAES